MKFGTEPVEQAIGAILAHGVRASGVDFRKGRVLSSEDVHLLRKAGIREIMVAHPDPLDIGEDEAAARIARALAGSGLRVAPAFTGRANLHAESDGLLEVDGRAVHRLNGIHEAVTLATLPPFTPLRKGQIAATVKIIPFAVEKGVLESCLAALAGRTALSLAPFRPFGARLIQTLTPFLPEKLLEKTGRVTRQRIESLSGRMLSENRCPHRIEDLARAISEADRQGFDLLLIAGASAITDRRDVVPAAIEAAGGRLRRFGMPVDPGNLLLLAELRGRPVLGLPGCCRSPSRNGLDWVLERLAAGIDVDPEDISRMGLGGLLAEIPSRPQPRSVRPSGKRSARVAAILLAAGQSRRMGDANKLLVEIEGKPMVRHVAEALVASRARPIRVVVGHEAERVRRALRHLPVEFVFNPDHRGGLSTSLRAGIASLPPDVDGAVICLGDMPRIGAPLIDRLIEAFDPSGGAGIVVPTRAGRRGNPVLFGRAFFDALKEIEGDVGARHLIGRYAEAVSEVEVGDEAIFLDLDTPEALERLGEQGG